MKIYDVITEQFAVYDCETGCFTSDVSRDEDEYRSVTFSRRLTMEDLKKMEEDDDNGVYDLIAREDPFSVEIECVEEYIAVLDSGEEVKVYVW